MSDSIRKIPFTLDLPGIAWSWSWSLIFGGGAALALHAVGTFALDVVSCARFGNQLKLFLILALRPGRCECGQHVGFRLRGTRACVEFPAIERSRTLLEPPIVVGLYESLR